MQDYLLKDEKKELQDVNSENRRLKSSNQKLKVQIEKLKKEAVNLRASAGHIATLPESNLRPPMKRRRETDRARHGIARQRGEVDNKHLRSSSERSKSQAKKRSLSAKPTARSKSRSLSSSRNVRTERIRDAIRGDASAEWGSGSAA